MNTLTLLIAYYYVTFYRALGAEQTLIIDLGKNFRDTDENYFYSRAYGRRNNNNNENNNNYSEQRKEQNDRSSVEARRINAYNPAKSAKKNFGAPTFRGPTSGARTQYTQPPYSYAPSASSAKSDELPSSVFELKNLLRQMDRTFSDKISSLSGRVDRLEANQNSFRRSVMAEWQPLNSIDKRIRLFNSAKNTWREAEEICEANTGRLLHIESADENEQISELLQAAYPINEENFEDSLYWIGMQSTLAFNIPTQNFTNFDLVSAKFKRNLDAGALDANSTTNASHHSTLTRKSTDSSDEDNSAEQLEDDDDESRQRLAASNERQLSEIRAEKFLRGCAAMSTTRSGKWVSRDCTERHQFICQL